jgi:hypothetical protein
MIYIVRRAPVEAAVLSHHRPEGSDHRPVVSVRLGHDGARLFGRFEVQDRYVRAAATKYGDRVWEDSCVEFFFQPIAGKGHFGFEFNCGGVFLADYITDPTRAPGGFREWKRLSEAEVSAVEVRSSLKAPIEPEIATPVAWWLEFSIPASVLEPCVGKLGDLAGQRWRGNFTKCADACSHPHWISWAPLKRKEFHSPGEFGELTFE